MLLTEPDAIEAVHLAYFEAGARVATTASYQATVPGFAAEGLDREIALESIRRSVAIAQQARQRFADERGVAVDDLLIAGSVGPYGAMLADGSEYRGDYDPGQAALIELHLPRMEALLESGADLLALETIPTVREAEVLVRLVESLGTSAWLSYQCRDARSTAAGEPIETAISVADGVEGIVAVGVNCTPPRSLPGLLLRAEDVASHPLIAYPNAGDRWDAAARRWVADAGGGYDPEAVASWRSLGATWLGGCCGTGPDEIARLVEALASVG